MITYDYFEGDAYFSILEQVMHPEPVALRFSPAFARFEIWDEDNMICYGTDKDELQELVDFLNETEGI